MKLLEKNIIIAGGIVFLTIALGITIAYFNTGGKADKVVSYRKGDSEAPRVIISEDNFDMGIVPFETPTIREVKIKNGGKKTLQLTDFKTSCGCTSVVLKVPGKPDSPSFEMHNNPTDYVGEIDPGVEAILAIKFDPKAHNIKGSVERTVFFSTNDPEREQATINFKAKVREGDHEEHHQ